MGGHLTKKHLVSSISDILFRKIRTFLSKNHYATMIKKIKNKMHILLLIDKTKTEDWGAGWLAGSLSDYSANTGSILQAETCELPS